MGSQPDDRRSTGHSNFVGRGPALPQDQPPALDLTPGQRCPRAHCGGLIVERFVASPEGVLTEAYCTACSRSAHARLVVPPRPARVAFSPSCEEALDRLCQSGGRSRASGEVDDSVDTAPFRSALDAAELYAMFVDECPPDGHIPSR